MKKIFASILAFVFVLSLAGCKSSSLENYQGPWYTEIGGNSQRTGALDSKDVAAQLDVIWSYQVPESYTNSTPLVVNNKIYFTSNSGFVYCIRESDAKEVWKFRAEASFTNSPIYHNGRIYAAANDGYVYALDAEKGTLIWFESAGYQTKIETTPVIAGNTIIVGTDAGIVRAYSLENGNEQWNYTTTAVVSSAPIITDFTYYDYGDKGGVVYFGASDGYFYALNAKTGKFIWSYNASNQMMKTATAYEGHVYLAAGDDYLYKFDALTGNIVWKLQPNPDYGVYFGGSPSIKDGKLILGAWDYKVYCIDIELGEVIWSFDSFYWLQSPATIVGNSVLISSAADRDENHYLLCLDFTTGELRWYIPASDHVRTHAVVLDGIVFFMDEGGRLLKLE